ncbi:protein NO VEIN domain-containing protein [Promicromonospora sukumoe]|uniref:protein NO VEIN domain-containing protein n=1 Tax=Promicromonospora sukumoe TaxID=88382 RepID=UPI0037C84049
MINEWWALEPNQRFWMETIKRRDYGDAIRAPHRKQDGSAWPYYELVKFVRDGDVVLHWDTDRPSGAPSAFVGWSIVDGAPYDTDNVVYSDASPTTGTEALLRDYTAFPLPFDYHQLNGRFAKVSSLRDELASRATGTIYFPFNIRKDDTLRAGQGNYLTKFPVEMFDVLPELADARGRVQVADGDAGFAGRSFEVRGERRQAIGAGYIADAKVRRAIEMQAVRQAIAYYESLGYDCLDVGASCSYDLQLTRAGASGERHVEVKGSMGDAEEVELTIGEVDHAHGFQPTDLFVVGGITWKRVGDSVITEPGQARLVVDWAPTRKSLKPIRYRHTVPRATRVG